MAFIADIFTGGPRSDFNAKGATLVNPASEAQANNSWANTQTGLSQQKDFVNALIAQGGLKNQSDVFGQQQALANQLGQQAQGLGPNPALAQFQQATGQNIANQAALMAGQRGASSNAGLLARQAAMQGAGIQQNAAGQSAIMQAQQQLAAQQQLQAQQAQMAQLSGNQVGQYAQGLQGLNASAQGQQQNILGALANLNSANVTNQSNANATNAGIESKNVDSRAAVTGGILKGAGAAATAGMMPTPKAHGGMITGYSDGGVVDGKAKVKGDSLKNDTVPTMLSPGEMVIPRTVMQSKDPVKGAAKFVKENLKQKGKFDGFEKVGANEAMTMLKHPSGHIIKIVNGALSPEMRKEIDGIAMNCGGVVKMNEGGLTEDPNEELLRGFGYSGDAAASPQSFVPSAQDVQAIKDNIEIAGMAPAAPAAPVVLGSEISAVPEARIPSSFGGIQGGIDKFKQGINLETRALGEQKRGEEQVIGQGITALENINKEYEAKYVPLKVQNEQLKKDVLEGKIDPNRLVGSMSTMQKIGTAIGLIAGGIGAGLTKSENDASKFLMAQIDNDIAAQRANLGKKENLLSMNLRELGDLQSAEQKTRADQMSLISLNLQKAAAASGDQLAKGRLMQEAAKFDIASAQLLEPLEAKRMMRQQLASGNAEPDQIINIVIPEKDRTAAREELSMVQGYVQAEKGVKDAFKKAKQMSTIGSSMPFSADKAAFESMRAELTSKIKSTMKGQGAVTDKDFEQVIAPLLPSKTDTESQLKAKQQGLINVLQSKISGGTPVLKGSGIDLERFPQTAMNPYNRLDPQQKKWADWAVANRNNPKAIVTLEKLGLD